MTSLDEDLHEMCHGDENETDDSVPTTSTIVCEDAEDLYNDDARSQDPSRSSTALGIFLAALMARSACSSATSSFSVATSPLPATSMSIVEDRARSLHRFSSLSFRRANRNIHQKRRRARAIDAKRISRWESYPQSQNQKNKSTSTFGSLPQRRLSPSPASSGPLECHYQTREAIHEALAMTADIETLRPSDTTFTLCSTWLDVVADHASFSPKPTPVSLKKMRPYVPAKADGVARLPKTGSGDALAASSKAKRAAALSGAPRRPLRQASLTNSNLLGNLSLKEAEEPISSGVEHCHSRPRHEHHHCHDRQRQRRQSEPSTSAAVPEVMSDGDQRSNHSVERKPREKHVDDTDGSEGSFQDASAAEWKQIGARSA